MNAEVAKVECHPPRKRKAARPAHLGRGLEFAQEDGKLPQSGVLWELVQ